MSRIDDMLREGLSSRNKATREISKMFAEAIANEGPALKALNEAMNRVPPPKRKEAELLWAAVHAERAELPADPVVRVLNAVMRALPADQRPSLSLLELAPVYEVLKEALEAERTNK